MSNISLQCKCGQVCGEAVDLGPNHGTRIVCYCDDCQAFAHFLGNEASILDSWGGTNITQMAQSILQVTRGADQIRCVRLSAKGMYRWYCGCCRTPFGNSLGPTMPFIGIIHSFFADEEKADRILGPVHGIIYTSFATGDVPEYIRKSRNSWFLLLRAVRKIVGWKLRGMNQPSPFFDPDGNPVSDPEILHPRPDH